MPFLAPSTNVACLFLFYACPEEKRRKKKNSTPGIRLTDTLDGRTLGIPFDDTKLAAGVSPMYRDDTMNSIVPLSSLRHLALSSGEKR